MKRVAALLAIAIVVAGCAGRVDAFPGPTPEPGALKVITTTSFLAEMVNEVGGTHVSVQSLVPKGGEVHTFDPRPLDALRISEARVIFMNGLGLDDWLGRLAMNVGTSAPIVRLGENLPGVRYITDNGSVNPHLWLDVANAELYVDRIVSTLVAADPADAPQYHAAGAVYRQRLAALDTWARSTISAIPAAQRRVVSFHDALPYFCRAYGLEIVGNVVPVPGQEPSAGQVRALVEQIRSAHVRAIFSEAQFNPALAQTIANDAGANVVTNLYTDTLGDAPADTFEGMVRWDVDRIVEALS